jgi:cation:H+ antiporter
VALFLVYVASVLVVISRGWLRPPADEDEDEDDASVSGRSVPALLAIMALALLAITGAAEVVVLGAVEIAERLGISQFAIGATVVAIGTTLPDKAISLVGGMRGRGGVVTANALGSNIFLLTLVLGLAALASGSGLRVADSVIQVDLPLLLAASVLTVLLFRRRSLHWRTGIALLALYVAYLAFVLVRG